MLLSRLLRLAAPRGGPVLIASLLLGEFPHVGTLPRGLPCAPRQPVSALICLSAGRNVHGFHGPSPPPRRSSAYSGTAWLACGIHFGHLCSHSRPLDRHDGSLPCGL